MSAPEIAVAYVSIVPEIQGFTRELRQQIVGPAKDAGAEAGKSVGGSLREKMKAGVASAGIAAGALLVKGIADALDQANVTSKLQAQLGATGKDAAKYGKVAGSLYSKGVSDSFESAAEAIKAVAQAGLAPPGATNRQLQAIATKASDVATVFDQDLGGVTNAVSQMIRTGLAKNSAEAFDILTKGFQSGANKADDLLDTFNEYGTQFRKLGLDGTQALGLIQQGIKGGARDADIAADALKEFSIRAVDGSKTTADGFKAIGLDAGKMGEAIGKGGKSANVALDLTLDKLRGIKDPVKQSAAATALFGTQAEDLGKALFKMDPSKAVTTVGKVGGAAKKMGDAIRSGPQHNLEVFTRTLQQTFVNVLGTYVVPVLSGLSSLLSKVGGWVRASFGVFQKVAPWLAPVAIAVGGLTLALNANAIATSFATGVFSVYRAAILAGTAVTSGFAAVQAALNAVMALNPFVLVAIALAALVAGIVVAYKHSETFRAIVQAAWQGIQTAAMFAWNSVLKPIFNAFAAVVGWLYRTIIKPIFGLIVIVFKVFWFAVRTYFAVVTTIFKALGKVAVWLYTNAIKPAFDWIADKIKWVYRNIILPHFNLMKIALRVLGNAFKSLYNSFIKPVASWIGDKVKWLWNNGVKPAFDAIKKGVGLVGKAFESAKSAIGKAWGKLMDIAKKPISFIINSVYNRGIVGVWNKVAGAFGAPKLPEFHPKGFATGGILPGYTPGRDVHLAALSGGEAVMRPEWTRAMGPGYVNAMNGLARRGGVGAVQKAMGGGMPAFKDGGVFGWISSAGSALKGAGSAAWKDIKKGASWLKDGLEASARAGVNHVVNPLLNRIPGLNTGFGKSVKRIPMKMVDALFGYSKTSDKKLVPNVNYKPGVGVAQWKPVVLKALGMVGQPASLLNTVLRRMNQESGGNPRAINKWDINAKNGTPSKGLMQTIDPTFNAYAGKLRGRGVWDPLANVYASMRYAMSRYGSLSSAYNRTGGYDSGGWLQPGATLAANDSGRPEPVLTAQQWQHVSTLASRGASGGLQPGDRLVLTLDGRTNLEAYVDRRADTRIHQGLVAPAALGRTL